jgi:hypothetical protein
VRVTKKHKSVPIPDNWDKFYEIGKLGVAAGSTGMSIITAIPISPLAMNLFTFIVKPPIQGRVNSWLNEVAERLNNLEQQ